jgi:hypothetical protein
MLIYCMDYDLIDHIRYIELEIAQLQSLIQPTDTGHIHTAIGVLQFRLMELYSELDCGPAEYGKG